jgi:hypothetical protein
MNLISKNLSQLRRIALAVLLASFAILETPSISAQEPGRTITSPFGVANPYMNASDASESGTDGDTFVDPETGEVGHIIRNPFGVANPEGVDTGIDIPDDAGEEVGGIITSPFGVPASDDIDTGVDVLDEDEEYLISLPDEETDVDERESVEDEGNADDTLDDAKDIEEESYEATTEKYVPVIDNPMRGVEFDSIITFSGTSTYTVESETNDINNAPTLYVLAGGYFTLTLVTNLNLPTNIQPIFRKLNQSGTQNPFEPLQSGSNPPYCFVYHVPTTMDGGTYCASISCPFNGVQIERVLKIGVVGVNKIVGPNSKSSTRSEAPSGTDKWQENEVIYAQPYSVFDLTMEVEPSLSNEGYDKIKDLISWSKYVQEGTLTPKENTKRKAELKDKPIGDYTITASIGSSHKIIVVRVGVPKINTVQFGGAKIPIWKDVGIPYYGVAWKDDNLDGESELDNANAVSSVKYQPVAYPSTSKITAQGTFKPYCFKIDKEVTDNPDSSDFIQGWDVEAAVKKYRFSHDNLNWSNWTISGPVEDSNPISTEAKVGYNLEYTIFWQYGFGETGTADDSLNDFSAGTSKHEMYLTYHAPIVADETKYLETVFHISCTNSNESNTPASIVSGIWDGFKGTNVKRKDRKELTYYKWYTVGETTVQGLLFSRDGQCGSWADFFQTALAIHGIQSTYRMIIPTTGNGSGFIVKTWSFDGTGIVGRDFPYTNKLLHNADGSPYYTIPAGYVWDTPAEVTYTAGTKGQNNATPASLFANHQLIEYGNEYYDPSYGIKHSSLQSIDKTLSGFYQKIYVMGLLEEMRFKTNPSGVQIEFY